MNESPDSVNETSEIVKKEPESVTFDYSSMDNETATFLQEKANNIVRIKAMSMLAVAKELKEAQGVLSNNKTGTFLVWCKSVGYEKSTVYDYIRTLDYIVRNSDNIENLESIKPSLLFAISKPSAPAELQKAVLDGDITSHKEYQEALKAKAEAEQEAKKAIEAKEP